MSINDKMWMTHKFCGRFGNKSRVDIEGVLKSLVDFTALALEGVRADLVGDELHLRIAAFAVTGH